MKVRINIILEGLPDYRILGDTVVEADDGDEAMDIVLDHVRVEVDKVEEE